MSNRERIQQGEVSQQFTPNAEALSEHDSRRVREPVSRDTGSPGAVARRRSAKTAAAATPTKVVQTFNTWSFKREQPDDRDLLVARVAEAMAAGEPIRFLLYWGKGPRDRAGEPEKQCLDYLASMVRRIGEAYAPGATFVLILTDTHAALNGHADADAERYFRSVTEAAAARGFSTRRLGELIERHDPDGALIEIGNLRAGPVFGKLVACARKWYHGDGRADDGAEEYFRMNMREKRVVRAEYPEAVFVTFNGSEFRCLFPDEMPIFYMYSIKRGVAVKPWFMDDDGTARVAVAAE